MGDAKGLQGAAGRQYVLVRQPHGEAVEASQYHHLDDAQVQLQLDVLGHVTKLLAPFGLCHLAGALAPQADVAAGWGQFPKESAHQGSFAGPVRADDHMNLPRVQSQAQIPQQGLLPKGEGESGYFKHVYAPCRGSAR
ncbi:hypothetical protein AERO9A_320146 [Aeromonas salmonicida]|nr:hypothetical protein AERO9A_320146 [Aeromonas salmonicida]